MSVQPGPHPVPRVTATTFVKLKQASRPIVVLTAYDYHSARIVEEAGVDAILVGDSLGMTMLGHPSTLSVTMDDMVRHTAAVSRAASRALVIADMPFMSYQPSVEMALVNAGRLLAEGGAQAVKIEGASESALVVTEELVAAGVPVMGHVGLTPQSVNAIGGYTTQAKDATAGAKLLEDCIELQNAGAFSIVLECIPLELAARASELLTIPTIGIGAGAGCDGQVQVFHDLLGIGDFVPRHAKLYAEVGDAIRSAVAAYADDVRAGDFPGEAQSTHVDAATLAEADLIFASGLIEEDDEE
jgi:3-methyl-2-oxobutanoate hydroxymethyltransferase